jgi:hypothetical protein
MPDTADPTQPSPSRRLARHAVTLLLIGLTCGIIAPTFATLLMALQANGLTLQLPYALMLAPWAIMIAGPGVFLLGVVFGWMLLVLAAERHHTLPARLALAVLVASVAWWLSEPLPSPASGPAAAPRPGGAAADWLVWAASAAAAGAIFSRGWIAHRLRHPTPLPPGE